MSKCTAGDPTLKPYIKTCFRFMAAHCLQPTEHSAVNIVDVQSEKRKKKRKKKKEPSYSVHGEVIWNDNIWDDNELTYYRRLREFWSTLCIDDRIQIASLEKDLVVLKMKEQQRITCNCDCCTQERREFEVDVEECFALYHDELIRMDMRNDYGDKLSQMPLEECALNDTEFVFYWSLSSDGHQISVSPELVEGGALFIDLLESSQYDDVDEDFYDRDFEDIQEATDDLTEVQLAWARLLVGRKFFQTFIARMFEERLLVAYREKLAFDKQQKLIAEEEEEERLRKERDENRQIARQRKRERKKEQKKAAADRKKAEVEEFQKAEQKKIEQEILHKLDEEKKRKDKRRLTRTFSNNDINDDGSSNSSGSRSSSVERALMENVPEQAKLSECMKKKNISSEKKNLDSLKPSTKLKKENKPPSAVPTKNGLQSSPKNSSVNIIEEEKPLETSRSNKKRRRKKNQKVKDVDTDILVNNTNIPGSSSIIPNTATKKDDPLRIVRKTAETPISKNITVGSNRVSPPNITKAAAAVSATSPESPKIVASKPQVIPAAPKPGKVSPKASSKPLYEKSIQIPIPQLKPVSKNSIPKNITIKKTQAQVVTTTTTTTVVASRAAPGYERSMNSAAVSSYVAMTTSQAMQILNSHTSTAVSMGATTQSVWGNTSPIPITSVIGDSKTTPVKSKPIQMESEMPEPRVPTPKAIGSERAADRAIGSERAKSYHKEMPLNGFGDATNCSPFANSNPQFFLGLQEILSSAKPNDKNPSEMLFENLDPDFSSGFPTSWTASSQNSLWSATSPSLQQSNMSNAPVSNSLDSSNSSRSSPEVNSLWMQQPPPSQTPPWSCTPIGTPKVPLTPPPLTQQQQQQQQQQANSNMPIPGIIHIPRSLAPSLSPFQAFSGLDQRGVRQPWTQQKLHSGFEMQPMRPS